MKLATPVQCQTCRVPLHDTDDGQGFTFAGRAPFVVCHRCAPLVRQMAATAGGFARRTAMNVGAEFIRLLAARGGVSPTQFAAVLGPVVSAFRSTSSAEK